MTYTRPLTAIHAAAEQVRAHYWPSGDIPVDIDRIIEMMGVDIVPTAGLRERGIDAYLSRSLCEIVVDLEYSMNAKMNFRFRFTLAHELGHVVLHRDELRKETEKITSLEAWIDHCIEMDGYTPQDIEANEFAGRLLVPRQELLSKTIPHLEDFRRKCPYPLETIDDEVVHKHLATKIHRHFEVSEQVIAIRIQKEKVYP